MRAGIDFHLYSVCGGQIIIGYCKKVRITSQQRNNLGIYIEQAHLHQTTIPVSILFGQLVATSHDVIEQCSPTDSAFAITLPRLSLIVLFVPFTTNIGIDLDPLIFAIEVPTINPGSELMYPRSTFETSHIAAVFPQMLRCNLPEHTLAV